MPLNFVFYNSRESLCVGKVCASGKFFISKIKCVFVMVNFSFVATARRNLVWFLHFCLKKKNTPFICFQKIFFCWKISLFTDEKKDNKINSIRIFRTNRRNEIDKSRKKKRRKKKYALYFYVDMFFFFLI